MRTSAAESIPTPTSVAGTQSTYTSANLTESDREALRLAGYAIPAPHDELGAARLWNELRGNAHIRLMIAAAALRSVVRYPDDPRLHPAPHPKAPVRSPKTPTEAARSPALARSDRGAVGADDVVLSVQPNPKRPGSSAYDRYALYALGKTRAELIGMGLTTADIRWDTERRFVVFGPAAEEKSDV